MSARPVLLVAIFGLPAWAEGTTDCQSIVDSDERLACYDAAARSAEPAEEQAPKVSAPTTTPAPEELFGKSSEEAKAMIAEASGVEDIDAIVAKVVAVSKDQRGRITVRLDNGQRWRQTRVDRFDVDVGDEVVVKEAALNSFTMQAKSGGRQTKVRRQD